MSAGERGEEVVQSVLVHQIDSSHARCNLVALVWAKVRNVVIAESHVEYVAWSNALRVVVIVFRAGSGDDQQF